MAFRHRRFARVFEMDRNGPPWEGTTEQQAAVREAFSKHQSWRNRFDRVLYAVDVAKNLQGRRFIPISFVESDRFLGFAFPSSILLNEQLLPQYIEKTLIHELGHIVGWNLFNPSDRSETWAEDFRHWVNAGTPDGPVWDRLKDLV